MLVRGGQRLYPVIRILTAQCAAMVTAFAGLIQQISGAYRVARNFNEISLKASYRSELSRFIHFSIDTRGGFRNNSIHTGIKRCYWQP